MTRSKVIGVSLLTLAVVSWSRPSPAQAAKSARGTLSTVGGSSITVKAGASDMRFTADSDTTVIAVGAGTKGRRLAAAGQPGPKLADLLKPGEAVIVTYQETGATMRATQVQVVSTAGPGGGSVSAEKGAPSTEKAGPKTAMGAVQSVSASALAISGGGRSTKTFVVDANTKVIGRGAGTKTAAAGGRIPITQLVSTGNQVEVMYNEAGGSMHAMSVRLIPIK
jgi:hypothetical protein